MAFGIDTQNRIGLSGGTALRSGSLTVRSENSLESAPEPEIAADTVNIGVTADVSNIQRLADLQEQAVDEISRLREEQLALASEAENSAQGERTSFLNDEIAGRQEEIDRIATEASFNDINVLSDRTLLLSAQDPSSGAEASIALAGLQTVTNDLNLDASTQAGAAQATEVLEASLSSLRSVAADVSSASNKAASVASEFSTEPAPREAAEEDSPSPDAIAEQIGNRFAATYGAADNSLQIVQQSLDIES